MVSSKNIKSIIEQGNKGATFATFDAVVEGKSFMNKTNNPFFDVVVKKSRVNGIIGFDYENNVNTIAIQEGKELRQAKPRVWGEITQDKIFVYHKGELYLRTRVLKTSTPIYVNKVTGEEVDKCALEPYFKSSSKSSTQSDLEGEVIERDYKISSIVGFKANGLEISNEDETIEFEVKGIKQPLTV